MPNILLCYNFIMNAKIDPCIKTTSNSFFSCLFSCSKTFNVHFKWEYFFSLLINIDSCLFTRFYSPVVAIIVHYRYTKGIFFCDDRRLMCPNACAWYFIHSIFMLSIESETIFQNFHLFVFFFCEKKNRFSLS